MDETVLEPTREGMLEEIKKCRRKIGTLLMIYFMVILLLVLCGGGNILFLIMAIVFGGGSVLGKILYAALPLFLWFYSQRANTSGRILMLYSVLEEIQVCIAMYLMLAVISLFSLPAGYAALLAVFGGWAGLTLLFIGLFRSAHRLGKLIFAAGVGDRTRAGRLDVVMVLVLVICYLAPALPGWDSIRSSMTLKSQMRQAAEVKVYRVKEAIDCMAGSPDGNLLALGTEKGLYVWDTRTRECVWSDDCLAVQRVRFSPGGRYLAAAGRGRLQGASDLAVYEVEGFRRLPGFDWPEHEEHKEKVFHDMMFRPDEGTLLVLWHRSWIWNRMSQGWDNDEAKAVKEREKELGHETDRADLLCTEVDVNRGAIGIPRTIRQGLSVYSELSPEGSAYFSSDASRFVYPTCYQDKGPVSVKWVHWVDTRTWEERVYQLDGYRLDSFWWLESYFEWKLNTKGTKAYLLGEREEKEKSVGVLLALDLKTEVKRDFPKKGKRLLLLPDERRVVTLAGDWTERTMLVVLNFLDIETRTEMKVIRKFDNSYRGSPKRFVCLNAELFAVAMDDQRGSLVFIDLDKEGK